MLRLIAKFLGRDNASVRRKLRRSVAKINAAYAEISLLSDQKLRNRTAALKVQLQSQTKDISQQIDTLSRKAKGLQDVNEMVHVFDKIEKLKKAQAKRTRKILNTLLPEAFAIVKSTAQRLKDRKVLRVRATAYDKTMAASCDYVTLEGKDALWHNTWKVVGKPFTWNMVHYDVQLMGGVVLHQGKIAEMATGEGKTIVATLPAFLNALAGKGLHIVTVNAYLAQRDAELNAPLYAFHGLRVDCIDIHEPLSPERKAAYQADITYGTSSEFGFDYLRDNMAKHVDQQVQRPYYMAILDEVDWVLVSDALTPLIFSGPAVQSEQEAYVKLKPRVENLYNAQVKLVESLLEQVRECIQSGKRDAAARALFRAHRGLPKYKPLISLFSEKGMKKLFRKAEDYYTENSAELMPKADAPLFFTIDKKSTDVELTDKGIDYISKGLDEAFFVLPAISTELVEIDRDKELTQEAKVAKKVALEKSYILKSARIHVVHQLLKAYALFEKDVAYVMIGGKVLLVDAQTGRILDGRRYSSGLHQALEAKEGVTVEQPTQTHASITQQNFFRMYPCLAGMTGTARTDASEFWTIYKLDIVKIATHKPVIRRDFPDKVYKTTQAKFKGIIKEIERLLALKRPILVGTTSVEISEHLSKMLRARNIAHQILNAKHHQKEAEIIAEAGQSGVLTIATNMAGRGTDIKLSEEATTAGGLAVVGTERHSAGKVDRQLRGRSGRQGDPGSSQFFLCLEDRLIRVFGGDRTAQVADMVGLKEHEVIQDPIVNKIIREAQKKITENEFVQRKRLLSYDNVLDIQRKVVYQRRQHALSGEQLDVDLSQMMYGVATALVRQAKSHNRDEQFFSMMMRTLDLKPEDEGEAPLKLPTSKRVILDRLKQVYADQKKFIKDTVMPLLDKIGAQDMASDHIPLPFSAMGTPLTVIVDWKAYQESGHLALISALERAVVLHFIDKHWVMHLQAMEDLRQAVRNVVYEQKDPLLVYKVASYDLFKELIDKIDQDSISYLLHAKLPLGDADHGVDAEELPTEHMHDQGLAENIAEQLVASIDLDHAVGRNDRVTVKYLDGKVVRDVKFKKVVKDLAKRACVLVEQAKKAS